MQKADFKLKSAFLLFLNLLDYFSIAAVTEADKRL